MACQVGGFCSLCSSFTTMVDIRSIAGSSHPSHHEQEATSCSRVGRSHWMKTHGTTATWTTTAATQRQCSAAMAAMTPPSASPEATLEAARQLLHNPLRAHASPSAVEEWCHEVDQLTVVAINTMPHRGRRLSAAHSCSLATQRAPSVMQY
jgi:hypothetical protein